MDSYCKTKNLRISNNTRSTPNSNSDCGKFKRKSIAKLNDMIFGVEIPWTRDLDLYKHKTKCKGNTPYVDNKIDVQNKSNLGTPELQRRQSLATACQMVGKFVHRLKLPT